MIKALPAACAAILISTSAHAIGFGGGQISAGYDFNFGTVGADVPHVEASLLFDVSPTLTMQFDANYSGYNDGGTHSHYTAGVHLTYALNPALDLGGFATYENWDGSDYYYYGVEARFDAGAATVEAFIAWNSWSNPIYGADLRAPLGDRMDLLAGGAFYDDGGFNSYLYGGLAYDISQNLSVEARLGNLAPQGGSSGLIASLDVVYSFGAAGDTWEQRNFSVMFPGY